MSNYVVKMDILPTLPDDRVTHTWWSAGQGGRVQLHREYRAGHLAEPLALDLGAFLRHLSYGELTFTPERAQETPDWEMYWERVDPEHLPSKTFEMIKTQTETGRGLYVCRVREDMITQALIDETNNEVMPMLTGLLRYSRNVPETFWRNAQALADGLDAWELSR